MKSPYCFVILYCTKNVLSEVAYSSKTYYHTSFQSLLLSGTSVAPATSCIRHLLITECWKLKMYEVKVDSKGVTAIPNFVIIS